MRNENPYPECDNCKTIKDCPHPDVTMDGLGSPMPPDFICPKPMEVMKETIKIKKLRHIHPD
jgi:hypothetical protein